MHAGLYSKRKPTRKSNPDLHYRFAMTEAVQLFESQRAQINFTIVHFVNVWGAEDQSVKEITAKLNSMKTYIEQKMNTLKAQLEGDFTPRKY